MVKEEGASSLARGVVPNVFRAVLMNASQLASWVAFRFLSFLCCIFDTPAPDTTISNQSFWRQPTSRITSTAILRLVLLLEQLQRLSALRPMSSRSVSEFLKNYKFTNAMMSHQSRIMNASGPGSNVCYSYVRELGFSLISDSGCTFHSLQCK